MNSLIIITGSFRFNCNEAASERVINNAKILRDLGHEVIFICWGGKYLESEKQGRDYFKQGFQYILSNDFIDNSSVSIFKRFVNFIFRGKKSIGLIKSLEPEIIISYNPSAFFNLYMIFYSKNNKKKYIIDVTEWNSPNEFPGHKWFPFAILNEFNMKYIQKKVKNKILISSFLNNYYKSNNIVIPPLIDVCDYKWDIILNRNLTDSLNIIYAGTAKNKDLLMEILNSICDAVDSGIKIKFTILGRNNEFKKRFNNIDSQNKYKDNVQFLGNIDHSLVPKYYANSDFSIIIRDKSKKNMAGFPTKFVESLASGCPVISNDTSDIKNYLINYENGFLIQDTSSELIYKLLSSISKLNVQDIINMRIRARSTAETFFSYKIYQEKMNNFIINLK